MKIFLDNIMSQNLVFIPIKTDNKRILIINENDKKKCYYISKKQEDWQNYRISTLEYLMWKIFIVVDHSMILLNIPFYLGLK